MPLELLCGLVQGLALVPLPETPRCFAFCDRCLRRPSPAKSRRVPPQLFYDARFYGLAPTEGATTL